MIKLEQIQKLEARVTTAVSLIKSLRTENESLRRTLDSTQTRLQEMEEQIAEFKSDQEDIEQSILRALDNLNELEEEIGDSRGDSDQEPAAAETAPEEHSEEELDIF